MAVHDCIFCKIIEKKVPAAIVEETDTVLVIKDRAPRAPIHYLIIPKKHIHDLSQLAADDASLCADMLFMARDLSKKLSGSQAFRLIVNTGVDAGQSVFHVHAHFLSGVTMSDF